MNNIILIKDFLDSKNENKLIINQVSDQIGVFYSCLIDYLCSKSKIIISRNQNLETTKTQSLFIDNNVFIHYSNNKKDIDKFIKMNDKVIIISDYRVFKEYSKKILSVNGYNYIKDIRYFSPRILLFFRGILTTDNCVFSIHHWPIEFRKIIIPNVNFFNFNI